MRRSRQAHRQAQPQGLTPSADQPVREPRPGLAVVLVAAVAAPVLLRGGYTPASQAIFVLLAGSALAAALVWAERPALAVLRRPAVLVLGALGALSAASAAWTVGDPAEALRWGLTLAGYAAVAVAAGAVAARPGGVTMLASVLAGIAGAAALLGVAATALGAEPWAERIYGRWQPGGPFEYPPALAMLQVAALPVLLRGMVGGAAARAPLAAAGAGLAAVTLGLATSRVAIASALVLGAVALLAPAVCGGTRRRVAAALLALAFPLALALLARRELDRGAGQLAALLLLAAIPPAAWWAIARGAGRRSGPRARGARAAPPARVLACAVAALLLAGLLGAGGGAAVGLSGPGGNGFTHGRVVLWEEALETWGERPLAGAGAGAYLAASRPNQAGDAVRYAHMLPLEAAVELGIAGLLLACALYAASLLAVLAARTGPAAWLFGPAVVTFLAFNLVDWTWHLAGAGAVWAMALGACLGAPYAGRGRP